MPARAEDSIPTRQSLLLRLKEWDDATGWREFFETYWELIYNVGRRAGLNDSAAQDVVQETVIAVARRIGEFDTDPGRGSFKSWLLGQARWRIGDQFREEKRGVRALSEPLDTTEAANEESTRLDPVHCIVDPNSDRLEQIWNDEWEQHICRTALERVKARVSVKQFQMFELHVKQGLSIRDTARALGATSAAVYMAKSRVGRLLKCEVKSITNP